MEKKNVFMVLVVVCTLVMLAGCGKLLPGEPGAPDQSSSSSISVGQAYKTWGDWQSASEQIRTNFSHPFDPFDHNNVFLTVIPEEVAISADEPYVEISVRDYHRPNPGLRDSLVYRYFYIYNKNGSWTRYQFDGTGLGQSNYIRGSARAFGLSVPTSMLTLDNGTGGPGSNYIIAYSCQRRTDIPGAETLWLCSCRNTSKEECSKYWSIQEFKIKTKKPNLKVLDLKLSPKNPAVDETTWVNVTIYNSGDGDAGGFNVDVVAAKPDAMPSPQTQRIPRLEAFSTEVVSVTMTFDSVGRYDFEVVLDQLGEVDETDESDNVYTRNNAYIGRSLNDVPTAELGYYLFTATWTGKIRKINLRGLSKGGSTCAYSVSLAERGSIQNQIFSVGNFYINESLEPNSEITVYMNYERNISATGYSWVYRPNYGDKAYNITKGKQYEMRVSVPSGQGCEDSPALQFRLIDDGNILTNLSKQVAYDLDMDMVAHEQRPDFKVLRLEANPDPVAAGEPFKVTVYFANMGDVIYNTTQINQSNRLYTTVVSNDPDVHSVGLNMPRQDYALFREYNFTTPILIFTEPGPKLLNVTIYAGSGNWSQTELAANRGDNTIYKAIDVVTGTPDVSIDDIEFDMQGIGSKTTFTPLIKNIGTSGVELPAGFSWAIEYKPGYEAYRNACTKTLASPIVINRNQVAVLPDCAFTLTDVYNSVKLIIDTTNVLDELDEDNNAMEIFADYSPREPGIPSQTS